MPMEQQLWLLQTRSQQNILNRLGIGKKILKYLISEKFDDCDDSRVVLEAFHKSP